jgi:hypothetical protein
MEVSGQLHLSAGLYPGKNSGTQLIRGWAGSRTGLDALENRKNSFPCRDSNSRPSSPQSGRYTDYDIPIPYQLLFKELTAVLKIIRNTQMQRVANPSFPKNVTPLGTHA